ncbi:hypothetical protein D9M72_628130 [compost metagenome]
MHQEWPAGGTIAQRLGGSIAEGSGKFVDGITKILLVKAQYPPVDNGPIEATDERLRALGDDNSAVAIQKIAIEFDLDRCRRHIPNDGARRTIMAGWEI